MRCGPSWKKKDKKCTEEERSEGETGSIWDHVAIDPCSKLVVSMIQGPCRDQESSDLLVQDFSNRTNHQAPELVTTDEHASYEASLLDVYGISYRPRRKAKRGPKKKLKKRWPKTLNYATVKKARKKGRVVDVTTTLVAGDEKLLADALEASPCSGAINTSFVERYNGSARHFNARKQRKTYSFSKQYEEHEAMSWLMVTHYNFCWKPHTLRLPLGNRCYRYRTPAMAAGITGLPWNIEQLIGFQIVNCG